MVRKPTVVKLYACIFVSLAVKTVHIEAVSDLTSESFIATLRRFIAHHGHPSLLWSDNGTNFIGANRELKDLYKFLAEQKTKGTISDFCALRNMETMESLRQKCQDAPEAYHGISQAYV